MARVMYRWWVASTVATTTVWGRVSATIRSNESARYVGTGAPAPAAASRRLCQSIRVWLRSHSPTSSAVSR